MKLKGHTDNVKAIIINPEGTQVTMLLSLTILNLKENGF